MSNSNWPSERAAGEALVKTAAVFLANGVRKVFYHAGSCGPINGSSAEGVFFAYGGTPRRLYPALAVLADRLGPAPQPLDAPIAGDQARAYVFKVAEGRLLAVAWATTDSALAVALKPGIAAADVMGNRVTASPLALTGSPVYLAAASADVLLPLLRELAGSGQPR
jgi:hypothetical protein